MNKDQFSKSLKKAFDDLTTVDEDYGGYYLGAADIHSTYSRANTTVATAESVVFEISWPGTEDWVCTACVMDIPSIAYDRYTIGYVLVKEKESGRVLFSEQVAYTDESRTVGTLVGVLAAQGLAEAGEVNG